MSKQFHLRLCVLMFVIIHCNQCVRFLIFFGGWDGGGGVENENVEVFYNYVWGNTITICKENQFKGIFLGYGVMFEDFSYGGQPCRLGQKMYPSRRCLRFSRLDMCFSYVNLLSSNSVLRYFPSLMYVSQFILYRYLKEQSRGMGEPCEYLCWFIWW